jgi:hypothetical protein
VFETNLFLSGGGSRVSAGCGGSVGISDLAYLCCTAFPNSDRIYDVEVVRSVCVGGGDRRKGRYVNGRGDRILSSGRNVSGGRNISSVCNFGGRIASGGCVLSGVHNFGSHIASGSHTLAATSPVVATLLVVSATAAFATPAAAAP